MENNQNQFVTITSDAAGNIVAPGTVSAKDGKTYSFLRVESSTTESVDGWLRTNKRSALIRGVKEDLQNWVRSNNLSVGSKLPGRIRIVENTTPAYEGMQAKRAGADGPELTNGGNKIYRHTEYCSPQNPNFVKPDVFLEHENVLVGTSQSQAIQPNVKIS